MSAENVTSPDGAALSKLLEECDAYELVDHPSSGGVTFKELKKIPDTEDLKLRAAADGRELFHIASGKIVNRIPINTVAFLGEDSDDG